MPAFENEVEKMTANAPEDLDRLFGEGINAGNVEAALALYEPNAVLVRQDGTHAIGLDQIRAQLNDLVTASAQLHLNGVKAVKLGDDLALCHSDWSASMAGPDGKRMEMPIKATEVGRRQPGGNWLFAIDDPFSGG
jgi:uncharacterized protein (TIGR02246 family)